VRAVALVRGEQAVRRRGAFSLSRTFRVSDVSVVVSVFSLAFPFSGLFVPVFNFRLWAFRRFFRFGCGHFF
jgi:hypothetical protein